MRDGAVEPSPPQSAFSLPLTWCGPVVLWPTSQVACDCLTSPALSGVPPCFTRLSYRKLWSLRSTRQSNSAMPSCDRGTSRGCSLIPWVSELPSFRTVHAMVICATLISYS